MGRRFVFTVGNPRVENIAKHPIQVMISETRSIPVSTGVHYFEEGVDDEKISLYRKARFPCREISDDEWEHRFASSESRRISLDLEDAELEARRKELQAKRERLAAQALEIERLEAEQDAAMRFAAEAKVKADARLQDAKLQHVAATKMRKEAGKRANKVKQRAINKT